MKIGLLSILGIIFVTLKLAEVGAVATWPWIWVLCPFWIGFAILGAVFLFGLGTLGIVKLLDKFK